MTHDRWTLWAVGLALLGADGLFNAAQAAPDRPAPIVNGQTEDGFPSVVALGAEFGGTTYSACTGNLITPRIVLSAAHCGGGIPLELVVSLGRAYFGTDVSNPDHSIGFENLVTHPDYEELDDSIGGLGANDVGVLILSEEALVEPTHIRFEEISSDDVGTDLFSVGFGVTSSAGYGAGTKRSATLRLDTLQEMFLVSYSSTNKNTANICSGDSGGPQFVLESDGNWVQWGIHSWGDANCTYSSGSTRTDLVSEWILDQVEEVHGTRDLCEINGWYDDGVCDERCDGIDPDCITDTAEANKSKACGCSAQPSRGTNALVLGALLASALLRRRNERQSGRVKTLIDLVKDRA